jgi:outer membrane protein OmpA-like peptidoglycan-associated protein
MKARLLCLAAALALAACQNGPLETPPPTGHPVQPPAHTVGPPAQVVTAGPLTSAGVGPYMDKLERDLRTRLRASGVGVARRGDDMLLSLPDARLFAGESLSPSGQSVLGSIAVALRIYDHTLIQVNGYTDTSGNPVQNLSVSLDRANLAGAALTGGGVAAERIEAHGFGETSLKVATGDHVNEPRNRRIEIRIVPRPG